MKKYFILIVLLFVLSLSSCLDRSKVIGTISDIKVYTNEEIELEGIYEDRYIEYYDYEEKATLAFKKLNSPRPRYYFLSIPKGANDDFIIKITLEAQNNFVFSSLITKKETYTEDNCQVLSEGNKTTLIISLNLSQVNEYYFYIDKIYFTKEGTDKLYLGGKRLNYLNLQVYGVYFYTNPEI